MDSRWLYRAAGTVGLASGIWLVGAGGAQADETETVNAPALDGVLGSAVSPTAGLTGGLTSGLPGGLVDSQLPLAGLATGVPAPAAETPDLVGAAVLAPLTDSLLAQAPTAPLGAFPVDALPVDAAGALPVAALPVAAPPVAASPVAASPVAALPVAGAGALPVDPSGVLGVPLPGAGEQLPALIADQLAAEAGLSPEHLTPLLPGLPALPEVPVLGSVSGLVPGL